jgi:DNA polymerase-4
VSRFGVPTRGWHQETRLSECQDNPTLNTALAKLWAQRPSGGEYDTPYFISVALNNLVPDRLHSLNLFDATDGARSRQLLLATMDQINNKYGLATLAPATLLTAFKAAPTRIAFHSIPELW